MKSLFPLILIILLISCDNDKSAHNAEDKDINDPHTKEVKDSIKQSLADSVNLEATKALVKDSLKKDSNLIIESPTTINYIYEKEVKKGYKEFEIFLKSFYSLDGEYLANKLLNNYVHPKLGYYSPGLIGQSNTCTLGTKKFKDLSLPQDTFIKKLISKDMICEKSWSPSTGMIYHYRDEKYKQNDLPIKNYISYQRFHAPYGAFQYFSESTDLITLNDKTLLEGIIDTLMKSSKQEKINSIMLERNVKNKIDNEVFNSICDIYLDEVESNTINPIDYHSIVYDRRLITDCMEVRVNTDDPENYMMEDFYVKFFIKLNNKWYIHITNGCVY